MTTHVRRHPGRYRSSGHLWQGRFKAFPIQEDEHLLAVLRYIERHPLRAGLVGRAEELPWSSLRWLGGIEPPTRHKTTLFRRTSLIFTDVPFSSFSSSEIPEFATASCRK
jgi:putative transposase